MGDVLLQKTYTPNLFEGKHKKNNGEVTQYYIKNHHPAIVSREMFQLAQEELARRNSKKPVTQKKAKTNRGRFTSNTPYRKDWFAETAAAITGESPGIFMEGNRWSGGALTG